MFTLRIVLLLYDSYFHYILDILIILHFNTILQDILIGSQAVTALTIDGSFVEDPSPSKDPDVPDMGSQIIKKLEIASGKLEASPAGKTTSVAVPENKDLEEELSSQGSEVVPTTTSTLEPSPDKRFVYPDIK